jgi:PhnB protein
MKEIAMTMISYLFFDGTCDTAMKSYAEVFGGTIVSMQRWSEMPANPDYPISDERKNRVMHARLESNIVTLMGADGTPGTEQKGDSCKG